MLVTLAVLATLETAGSPVVELTRSGASRAPVAAAPRSLSDVARERREGRTAVGGFSAVETTVPRGPALLPVLAWEEDEARVEPELPPEPQPSGWGVPYGNVWLDGGSGGAPRRRPPHVRPHTRPSVQPFAHRIARAPAPMPPPGTSARISGSAGPVHRRN